RKSRPAERTNAAAKERADVGRHEAREIKRIGDALLLRDLADVVAVVEGGHTHFLEREHRFDVLANRGTRGSLDALRIALDARFPVGNRPALWTIAVDRIMRRSLIGHQVGLYAAPHEFGIDFR